MENFTVLNYQGSKNNLSSFIKKNIEPYIQDLIQANLVVKE